MQTNLLIRKLAEKDNPQLAKLIRAVLIEFNANKPGTVYFDASTDNLFQVFTTPKSAYWVIEENGFLIGAGGIFPTEGLPPKHCELVKLYLYPQARKRGLGKALMLKCFKKASSLGFTHIYLETMPELNAAVSLYEKIGFKYQCAALGKSGHFGCDIWMVKTL